MKPRVFLRKLIANKTALSGLIIIAVWVAVTISAPVLAPYDPLYLDVSQRLQEPGPGHPFGTDELGRDIYSRVLYGSRISLPASFLVTLIASLIGGSVGAIAGFFGGWFDNLVMRIADVALAFPAIVLAMAITVVLEPGLGAIMIALIVIWWPRYARIVRGTGDSSQGKHVCLGQPIHRDSRRPDPTPARAAELLRAASRAVHHGSWYGDLVDRRAGLPWPWHKAACPRVGYYG